mmetsp:Transcript_108364/g.306423  ORF Transcript_108364/g.306423 Transcript_108364/m.306423 type:complete len:255 (+) Transcript_108364:115-879(+)
MVPPRLRWWPPGLTTAGFAGVAERGSRSTTSHGDTGNSSSKHQSVQQGLKIISNSPDGPPRPQKHQRCRHPAAATLSHPASVAELSASCRWSGRRPPLPCLPCRRGRSGRSGRGGRPCLPRRRGRCARSGATAPRPWSRRRPPGPHHPHPGLYSSRRRGSRWSSCGPPTNRRRRRRRAARPSRPRRGSPPPSRGPCPSTRPRRRGPPACRRRSRGRRRLGRPCRRRPGCCQRLAAHLWDWALALHLRPCFFSSS